MIFKTELTNTGAELDFSTLVPSHLRCNNTHALTRSGILTVKQAPKQDASQIYADFVLEWYPSLYDIV